MARPRQDELWRAARDPSFLVLCLAVVVGLIPSVRQPSIEFSFFGSTVSLVPADIVFAVLGALVAARLLGSRSLPAPARAVTLAATAFSAWLVLSSLLNGADAVVGALKLLEYGVIGIGAVLFVRRRAQVWSLVALLVAVTAVAVVYALPDFLRYELRRQNSFLGYHDLAALATMSLLAGLAALFVPRPRWRLLAAAAGIAGAAGVVLGAALAGLLGLYLGAAAIVGLAAVRRLVTPRALLVTTATLLVVTGSVLLLRSVDLFGDEETPPGEVAGSIKQRLIFAYIGGRVFLDNPIAGTGWHGELPPEEYARYLPDARERFPEQPPHYFPPADGTLIPQQTYDQILFELGAVGGVLFLVLAAAAVLTAVRVGRSWPRAGPDGELAYLPAAWLGSLAGALAGAALFGGVPVTAMFWLTLGVAALAPSLVPPSQRPVPLDVPSRETEPAVP